MAYVTPRSIKRRRGRENAGKDHRRLRGRHAEYANRQLLMNKPGANIFGLLRDLKELLTGKPSNVT